MDERGVVEGEGLPEINPEVEAFEKREPIISVSINVSISIFLLNTVSSKS